MKTKVNPFYKKTTLNLGGKILDLSTPAVMGILNVTPDSFFDGGKNNQKETMLTHTGKMLEDGAEIIDVGGYSSRPGATDISAGEEIRRVTDAVRNLILHFPDIRISVDTFRASVAAAAIEEGALMINDISAGGLDPEMFPLIIKHNLPYVLMHMKGNPGNMSQQTGYGNLIGEMLDYFGERLKKLSEDGVSDLIIDPGFGFSKTMDQNYELLKNLNYFEVMEVPVLVGLSRKSMFYKLLGTTPDYSLNATTAAHMVALRNGASILRVHDVKEATEAIKIFKLTDK